MWMKEESTVFHDRIIYIQQQQIQKSPFSCTLPRIGLISTDLLFNIAGHTLSRIYSSFSMPM